MARAAAAGRPECALGHTPCGQQGAAGGIVPAAAAAAASSDFGESYLQEALEKMAALQRPARSPGTSSAALQANKTAPDRGALRLGARRRPPEDRRAARGAAPLPRAAPLNVCLQVNLAGEASKGGVRAGGAAGARRRRGSAAAPRAARPDVHPAAGEPTRAPARTGSPAAAAAQGALNAGGAAPRHAVDGHERRLRGGDPRRRDPGAHRHRALWCRAAPPAKRRSVTITTAQRDRRAS